MTPSANASAKPTHSRNLEATISAHSKKIAEALQEVVASAGSEEDVRHGTNTLLEAFLKDAGLKVKGKHEYWIGGGRVDSKYAGVVLEYKYPHGPDRLQLKRDAKGTTAAVAQVSSRFAAFQAEEHVDPVRLFGVATDGVLVVYVRHRGGALQVDGPRPATAQSIERLLRALVALGARGNSFTPAQLASTFGARSPIAARGVAALYDAFVATTDPKAQAFFGEWKLLFAEACGYDFDLDKESVKELVARFKVTAKPQAAALFFAIHTYYAVFLKLLAAEITSTFSPVGSSAIRACVGAHDSKHLLKEMSNLEQGGIWSQLGINNFLEGDFFSWYLSAWNAEIARAFFDLVKHLDEFDPTTLSVEPDESRDLLKQLYHHLLPQSVRHNLGEYYTPDWLAEHVLNQIGYDGNPDKRLLDPACGSGTFLVAAINRVRAWAAGHPAHYSDTQIARRILANIVGFDLNPLAVMAARTNVLLAIRDLLPLVETPELPVYLCDSIATALTGSLEAQTTFLTEAGITIDGTSPPVAVSTSAGMFLVPRQVAESSVRLGSYAEILESAVRAKCSPNEFVLRCSEAAFSKRDAALHSRLYEQLATLDREGRNGIWARIIRNAFAPLFVGRFDYIAGNPPWVNWANLPTEYRDGTAEIWQRYELFPHKGLRARLGGAMDDISVLMTYVSLDAYAKPKGRLGFVITQTVFRTEGGGEGFRRFRLDDKRPLRVSNVHDLSSFQPFEDAANRTATVVIENGKKTTYPLPYVVWKLRAPVSVDMPLETVLGIVDQVEKLAKPVSPSKVTSPWIVGTKTELAAVRRCFGPAAYKGRYGTHCHASGIYWVNVVRAVGAGKVLVTNLGTTGKKSFDVITKRVDERFVFPLTRGRDIDRWSAATRCHMILPQDASQTSKPMPEATMRVSYPDTYAFLKHFETGLRERSGYKQFFRPGIDPFYAVYNVGPYTFADYKVMWREVAQDLRAAVVEKGGGAVVVPDHTLVSVDVRTCEEAHYLCAVLNSAPSNYIVTNYVALHPGPHVLNYIHIPSFNHKSKLHRTLASLSRQCHKAVAVGAPKSVLEGLESQVNEQVALLWGLTSTQMAALQSGLE